MNKDRRVILSLVAAGRITASEAERLLAAWNDSRETVWIVILCLLFACLGELHLRELLPALVWMLNMLVPIMTASLQHGLSEIGVLGGLL